MTTDGTELDVEQRCKSEHMERPGHTHHCKLTTHHSQKTHLCVCGRHWEHATAGGTK